MRTPTAVRLALRAAGRPKQAASVIQVYPKRRKDPVFLDDTGPLSLPDATLIARAMSVGAPHGALDNTRVNLNGAKLTDLQQRTVDNPRLTGLQRYLNRMTSPTEGIEVGRSQMLPDAYYSESDDVWLPSGNSGILMHELGHAADFNGYPNTTPRMLLAGLYARTAPTLWTEHAAWRKGRNALLEGGAETRLPAPLVQRTLMDASRTKPLGLGSYWGAGLGGLLGTGLGALGTVALASAPGGRVTILPPLLGGLLGAGLGGLTGTAIGRAVGNSRSLGDEAAMARYLDEYAAVYARRHGVPLEQARAELLAVAKKGKGKKGKKPAGGEKAPGAAKAAAAGAWQAGADDDGPEARKKPKPFWQRPAFVVPAAAAGLLGAGYLGYKGYQALQRPAPPPPPPPPPGTSKRLGRIPDDDPGEAKRSRNTPPDAREVKSVEQALDARLARIGPPPDKELTPLQWKLRDAEEARWSNPKYWKPYDALMTEFEHALSAASRYRPGETETAAEREATVNRLAAVNRAYMPRIAALKAQLPEPYFVPSGEASEVKGGWDGVWPEARPGSSK